MINQFFRFMNRYLKKALILLSFIFAISCNSPGGNENTTVIIKTTVGDITIKLYDGTPAHRDNFIRLINSGFYEGVSFHRIIKSFMIQAGDPDTKSSRSANLPDSLKTFTIPPEINSMYFHKKGALCAARQGDDINPEKRSSGTQFYIVEGEKLSDQELNQAEQKINSNIKQNRFAFFMKTVSDSIKLTGQPVNVSQVQQLASVKMFQYLTTYTDYKISSEQRNIYKTIGGTPRLDATYTVFGEVTDGMRIVDKISETPTDSEDKPITDIKIVKIKIVKN
jgi:cyclophilin family peptidyl-prolyl cis-trans isomerase